MTSPEWLSLLRAAVAATSQAQVGRDLGYSGSAVNQVLQGTYKGSTARIEAAVLDRYGRLHCPHLGQDLAGVTCQAYRTRPMPTSDPRALRHWAACRRCPHNPQRKEAP